ncbi:hypothetical protein CNECB9_1920024 [Cupriavidus necator]|uniref:Glucose-methanol-choline oxidoreductase C-terminal domain-containing protein n=1 Tax=Cupriavidus necator TaxID=106590 RepID=A0A1K0IBH1_CUPNE|nr:hypothetical protein CNECB9_1920024 [Cupriavidus necator]
MPGGVFFARAGLGKLKSPVLHLRPRNANHGNCREVWSDQQVAGSQPVMVERVLSSVGRAAPLQGVGRGFEPLSTHHRENERIKGLERSGSFFFMPVSPPRIGGASDPAANPLIDPRFLSDSSDFSSMQEGVEQMCEITDQPPLRRHIKRRIDVDAFSQVSPHKHRVLAEAIKTNAILQCRRTVPQEIKVTIASPVRLPPRTSGG